MSKGRQFLALLFCLVMCFASSVGALDNNAAPDIPVATTDIIPFDLESGQEIVGYVARLGLNDPSQVFAALLRAEELYFSADLGYNSPPIIFILHGPEVAIFFKDNYQQYKSIVDLAARLQAFAVVDIKVCATRVRVMELEGADLYPFVGTVIYGPRAIDELINERHYGYF